MSETYPCHFCPYGFPHYSEEFETRANKRSTLVSVFHDKIRKQLTRNLTNSNSCKYFIDFPLMAYQFERAEKVAQLKETELEEVVGYVKAKGLWGKVEKRPDETEMIYCMRLMEWDEVFAEALAEVNVEEFESREELANRLVDPYLQEAEESHMKELKEKKEEEYEQVLEAVVQWVLQEKKKEKEKDPGLKAAFQWIVQEENEKKKKKEKKKEMDDEKGPETEEEEGREMKRKKRTFLKAEEELEYLLQTSFPLTPERVRGIYCVIKTQLVRSTCAVNS